MNGRRTLLKGLGGLALAGGTPLNVFAQAAANERGAVILKNIPGTRESLPAVGMGSWQSFDVDPDSTELAVRREVLLRFFKHGGRLVDSSPMYGRAEQVLGECLDQLQRPDALFSATKVWTRGRQEGIEQMAASARAWGLEQFDLIMVHNLVDWQTQLPTLQQMKAEGRLRYDGITTSHGLRHDEVARLMREQDFNFVQLTYNIANREAEQRLLPLARERGCAVLVNRPFDGGNLFRRVRGQPLPPLAAELGCEHWSQLFLKFIIGHPDVTVVIPATSKTEHMDDNMGALYGPLPDQRQRQELLDYFENLPG